MAHEIRNEIRTFLDTIKPETKNKNTVYEFGRWKFFEHDLNTGNSNRNFEINGNATEKIIVRVLLDSDQQISRSKYYYTKTTDSELARYLVKVLITKIERDYPLSLSYFLNQFEDYINEL